MAAEMLQVLWYGRGGQGAFSAAKLLGAAFAFDDEQRYALAFPSFGPERRGAPVRAYTKLSSAPINDRSAVTSPDYVVCLDATLLGDLNIKSLMEKGSLVCVSPEIEELCTRVLGRPIVNTALLTLLAYGAGILDEEGIVRGIEQALPARIQKRNIQLVHEVYAQAEDLLDTSWRLAKEIGMKQEAAPKQENPLPHELNHINGQVEYMDLSTANSFGQPHKEYRPGGRGGAN